MLIEIILIIAIIVVQFFLASKTYLRIITLKRLFHFEEAPQIMVGDVPISLVDSGSPQLVESYITSNDKAKFPNEKFIEIAIISALSNNDLDNQILHNINSYLIKNKGAVADYHLLKDVIDREVETLDEEINNGLPAPLYLGLAATMLGIIVGLIRMPTSFNSADFDVMAVLSPLLDGVKFAMGASLCGLGLTTYLSIGVYKNAKWISEKKKTKFLSFLQVNLLPELYRTETSGISALNDRLKGFGRTLAPAIASLSEVVERSLTAVKIQQEVVGKIEKLDANKLSKANVTIFNKIWEMMDSFNEFAAYYQELNRSMAQTVELTSGLKDLVIRTKNFEVIAKGIENTFQQNKDLNQFLADHLIDIKSRETALQNLVDSSERNLKASFDQMEAVVQEKINAVRNLATNMEPEVKQVFASTVEALERMTEEQVSRIHKAFESARPQFEKLDTLDKIETGISNLSSQGVINIQKQDAMLLSLRELVTVLSNRTADYNDSPNTRNDADLLVELRGINRTLNNARFSGDTKYNRRNTVLLAVATASILSLVGFTIYALVKGVVMFW